MMDKEDFIELLDLVGSDIREDMIEHMDDELELHKLGAQLGLLERIRDTVIEYD